MTGPRLVWETVRHLKFTQAVHQILNRLPQRAPPLDARVPPRRGKGRFRSLPGRSGMLAGECTFTFLNVSRTMPPGNTDWRCADMPKLWRYNLHYFDYLFDEGVTNEAKIRLMHDWIEANPPGTADAWEPYPTSLRVVNWLRWLAGNECQDPARLVEASVFAQLQWLEKRLEYHLLGNHLLKNAVALFVGGAWFAGEAADRWLARGWRMLGEQLQEQFLADGGHYERSPMYHAICLVDYLDCLVLARSLERTTTVRIPADFDVRIAEAVGFLRDLTFPDGEIALFNDAAFGIAPPPAAIFAYAEELLPVPQAAPRTSGPRTLVERPRSGYFGVKSAQDALLIDCGAIGPAYQPGHAHCDTLSYELVIDGTRLVVDTGVFDYESGTRRAESRSTRGHNTVMLDNTEQSEIWASFRVGRRASPLAARIESDESGVRFEGAHDGYCRLPGKPIHRRDLAIEFSGRGECAAIADREPQRKHAGKPPPADRIASVMVTDAILGKGLHLAESRVRLHPDYSAVAGHRCVEVKRVAGGAAVARIEFLQSDAFAVERGWYFPRFGTAFACDVVTMKRQAKAPFTLSYRITRVA